MHKLLSTLTAGALALALSGFAFAQQDQQDQQSQDQQSQQSGQSAGQTGDAQSEEYQAALRKCETMGAADKQKCINDAKKKHGQM